MATVPFLCASVKCEPLNMGEASRRKLRASRITREITCLPYGLACTPLWLLKLAAGNSPTPSVSLQFQLPSEEVHTGCEEICQSSDFRWDSRRADPTIWCKSLSSHLQLPAKCREATGEDGKHVLVCGRAARGRYCGILPEVIAGIAAMLFVCAPAWAEVGISPGITEGGRQVATPTSATVESILAQQLARRFRELSDQELADVLEQLLRASRLGSVLTDEPPSNRKILDENITQELGRGNTYSNARGESSTPQANAEKQMNPPVHEGESSTDATPLGLETNKGKAVRTEDLALPKIIQDRKLPSEQQVPDREDMARMGKESSNQGDLTTLLWEDLQKRLDMSGEAKLLGSEGSMGKNTVEQTNSRAQGVFEDTKVLALGAGALVASALFSVGAWKFLDSRVKKPSSYLGEGLKERSGENVEASMRSPWNTSKGTERGQGLFRSILTALQALVGRVRGVEQVTKQDQQNMEDEGTKKPRGEDEDNYDTREAQPGVTSSMNGSLKKGAIKGKGADTRESTSGLNRRGSLSIRDDSIPEVGYQDEGDMLPSIRTYRKGSRLNDAGPRYDAGKITSTFVASINPGEQSWSTRSVPKSPEYEDPIARDLATDTRLSYKYSALRSRDEPISKFLRRTGNNQDNLMLKTDGHKPQKATVSSHNMEAQRSQVDEERQLQRDDGQVTMKGTALKEKPYDEQKLEESNYTYRLTDKHGLNMPKRSSVARPDYWAKSGKNPDEDRVSNESSQLKANGESCKVINGQATTFEMDCFFHKGTMWVRDMDGVFVQSPLKSRDPTKKTHVLRDKGIGKPASKLFSKSGSTDGTDLKMRKGRQSGNRGKITDAPGFDYHHLVLQHVENDFQSAKLHIHKRNNVISDTPSSEHQGLMQVELTSPLTYGPNY